MFYETSLENNNITITGKILFEGWEEIPAEMEVSAFTSSKKD